MKLRTSEALKYKENAITTLIVDEDNFMLENLVAYHSLTSLYIKNTNRKTINLHGVQLPSTLKNLFIVGNQLLTNILINLESVFLNKLHIIGNTSLDEVPDLNRLNHLKQLVVRQNGKLGRLRGEAAALPLELIDFSSNQLTTIHPSWMALPLLKKVVIYDNFIEKIDYYLSDSVEYLSVRRNKLKNLELVVAKPSIRVLDLGMNNFSCFPVFIKKCKFIQTLILSSNDSVKTIPSWLGDRLPCLEELHLTGLNQLNTATLVHLPKTIEVLHLSYCNLKIFPQEILDLPSLKALFLNGNHIAVIPKEIEQLNKLEYLEMKNNSLTTIPMELLNIKRLEGLDLEYNYFNDASVDTLIVQMEERNIEYNI